MSKRKVQNVTKKRIAKGVEEKIPSHSPLTIMVASSVHGFEDDLQQIYATLSALGYEVWCSYKGTIPTHPGKSNLQNCLMAVQNCDLFLGILRPFYGTGIVGDLSITHQEMKLAVELRKPRWFLAHRDIDLIRQLLRKLYILNNNGGKIKNFCLEKGPILDDLRVIDMYNDVLMNDLPVEKRTGHWVQPFFNFREEGLNHIKVQFKDIERIRGIVNEMKQV